MTRRIQDMIVVVTGASAGIGAALARQLVAGGARVVVAARRMDRLEALATSAPEQVLAVRCDVARRQDCEDLLATARDRFGRIDTLVCNAGYGLRCAVADTSPEAWDDILRTNLLGTVDCMRAAIPGMRQQDLRDGWRAQIMIVSSILARRGVPEGGAYSATKAAQMMLAEAARVELASDRIAVTSVHPIGTDSEFVQAAADHGGRRWMVGRGEMRQTPEQVARAMIAGIARPRPEVWPHRLSRWAVPFAMLFPAWTDRLVAGRLRDT